MSWEIWGSGGDSCPCERILEAGWVNPDDAKITREQIANARAHVVAAIDLLAAECAQYDPDTGKLTPVEKNTTAEELRLINGHMQSAFLTALHGELTQIWNELQAAKRELVDEL